MKHLLVVAALFGVSLSGYSQDAKITFSSDDQVLVKGFEWAKKQAMAYVFRRNDPVGDWYEAALPNREAFCMRDVSHQLVGAQLLGLADINKNLLTKFVSAISESRDWCGYWEINRYNLPAPVDYKSDKDFWYNLPANFDIIDACYRAWLWTGDKTYLFDERFTNFYVKSLNEYVKRWDPDGDGRMEGCSDSTSSRGLSSYNEEKYGRVGVDLLAAQRIGYSDYSKMLAIQNIEDESHDYQLRAARMMNHINAAWWDPVNKLYHHYIKYDGKWLDDKQMMSFLLRWDIVPKDRADDVINHLISVASKTGVEMNTYYPLEIYRYGKAEDAYLLLIRLLSPNLKRREYPEVSFAALETIAMGVMGMQVDAATRTIRVASHLTAATSWAELKDIPVFDGTVTLRHDGTTRSELTNNTGAPIIWCVTFPNGETRSTTLAPGQKSEFRN